MKKSPKWNLIVAVVLVAATIFIPSSSIAQSTVKSPGNAVQKDESRGGQQEGIKVHGHWTIVVKNPDGSVASHHEFENSLVGSGSDLLAQLLARSTSPGDWGVVILPSQPGTSSCGGNISCIITEPNTQTGAIVFSSNLTVAYVTNPSRTTLQGSYQASAAGDVGLVITQLGVCPGNVTPTTCPSTPNNFALASVNFSSHTVSPAIAVQSGQIVQVTVTFTFS